ncbi:hypothetical protein [Ensifer sp.]|uniref:hypothetical protein n=1 Tax=Ensifer sp. TaxID=1872086 RepID=UPI0028A2C54B|nr:hypothetical protein [Ensifer sp.]
MENGLNRQCCLLRGAFACKLWNVERNVGDRGMPLFVCHALRFSQRNLGGWRQVDITERQLEFTLEVERRLDLVRRKILGSDIGGGTEIGFKRSDLRNRGDFGVVAINLVGSRLRPCLLDWLICRFDRRQVFYRRRFGYGELDRRKLGHGLELRRYFFCRRNSLFSRTVVWLNIDRARRVVGIELAKKLFLEVEGRILTDGFLVALQFLQLLDSRPCIVADDPGEFGQRIIVCQYIEFSRPASCELFVCHALHSQLPAFTCQCIVGKW